jgi:DNA-binding Lrp family transcriptional regulator
MPSEPIQFTEQQKEIIKLLQGDIPVCATPFREIAQKLGISEDELLMTIKDMKARGIVRRFGATLRHQKVGFRANAMSAWKVKQDRVEEVGTLLASSPHVTHCYERPPTKGWPYNLYAMIHGRSPADCEKIAEKIAKRTEVQHYILLFSSQENKKESMQYF